MRRIGPIGITVGLLIAGGLVADGLSVSQKGQYKCTGAGCVAQTIARKLSESFSVCDFEAAPCPNGVDDTAAITSAVAVLNANGGALIFPPGTYAVTNQFSITKAYARVVGYGAKIVQSGALKRGFTANAAGVTIEGLWLFNANGNSEWADAPAGSTNAIGIYFDTGCDGCNALNNKIDHWGYAGLRLYQSKYVEVRGNEFIGIGTDPDGGGPLLGLITGSNNNIGLDAYLSGIGYPGLQISGNVFRDLAQGIVIEYDWSDVAISGNEFFNIIGQHGIYAGNLSNSAISYNIVNTTGQNGIKVQISANATVDSDGVAITGNSIALTGGNGIDILPATGGLTPRFKSTTIVGNTIRSPSASGISIDQADDYDVSGNTIRNAGTFGIVSGTASGNGRIDGNMVLTAQQTGIYGQATSTSFVGSIQSNTLDGVCAAGSGASDVRAVIYMGSGKWIEGNNFILNDGSCGSNVNVGASAIATMRRNFPGTKNNTMAGTATAEGLTANTTGSNGVTVTPNLNTTTHLFETVTFATWTVGAPTNVNGEAFLIVTVSNASGGAITTTWNANLHLGAAWVEPLNGFNRSVWFKRNNNTYYEIARTSGDVAN